MGYRSDVVIAVNAEVRARHLIAPCIPSTLMDDDDVVKQEGPNGALYFSISHWKWYSSYPEVQEIEAWFASMPEEDFGAMRIGEDDNDTETWGSPYDFDIYLSRSISSPISD